MTYLRQALIWLLALVLFVFATMVIGALPLLGVIPVVVLLIKGATAGHHPVKWMRWALIAILLNAIGPLIAVTGSQLIAASPLCSRPPGSSLQCFIFGVDWGVTIDQMQLLVWLFFYTVPISGIALIIWIGIALQKYLNRRWPPQRPGI